MVVVHTNVRSVERASLNAEKKYTTNALYICMVKYQKKNTDLDGGKKMNEPLIFGVVVGSGLSLPYYCICNAIKQALEKRGETGYHDSGRSV